jgi:hypothetical protein
MSGGIFGAENMAIRRAEKDPRRMAGVDRQGSDVAPWGPEGVPLLSLRDGRGKQPKRNEDQGGLAHG